MSGIEGKYNMIINGYELEGELQTVNSGNSRWAFAKKSGQVYFVKEFLTPVYPVDTTMLEPDIIKRKRDICNRFENRQRTLYDAINKCSNGNLVRIEHFFRCDNKYYMVMKKIWEIKLGIVLREPEDARIRICRGLLHCIGNMHKVGIVHSDIKLTNIIFQRLPSGNITAKVIDFDNCFWESEPPDPAEELGGDQVYLSPEAFQIMAAEEGKLTAKTDVFALGLLFHQIMTGDLPAFNKKEYHYPFEVLLSGDTLQCNNTLPTEMKALLVLMLHKDPLKRISLMEAEERFFKIQPETKAADYFQTAGDL